jgi:hypothetical protein
VWLISLWQPLFTDRYLIWTAPAFYLLVAVGWSVLWRGGVWARRVAALSITLVLVFDGINLWRQATVSIKSDVRGAVAYVIGYRAPEGPESADPLQPDGARLLGFRQYLPLVQRGSAGIEGLIVFQIPYIRHAFDYYSPVQGYEWADGLYTNHRHPDGSYVMSEAEAGRRMREMMQGHHVIWLVVTEEWMWDERGLVHAWLEENAQLESEAHFAHVDVCRYIR